MVRKKSDEKLREPLSRERVLQAALTLVDEEGLGGLSMRKLGQRLGVEAMSLYNHVASKEAILDGLTDLVVGEIYVPQEGENWREAMHKRAVSVSQVYTRYPWALGMLESRKEPSPDVMAYANAVIGCLRTGGFSPGNALLAFSLLDSYIYGYLITVQNSPYSTPDELSGAVENMIDQFPVRDYPHLAELVSEYLLKTEYSYETEFLRGLELILDGIALIREKG